MAYCHIPHFYGIAGIPFAIAAYEEPVTITGGRYEPDAQSTQNSLPSMSSIGMHASLPS